MIADVVLVAATVVTGLLAGFFYTFARTAMPGFAGRGHARPLTAAVRRARCAVP